jgi:DNA-binding beta-propeller fold protein YncE
MHRHFRTLCKLTALGAGLGWLVLKPIHTAAKDTSPLVAQPPMEVPNSSGGFDYMLFDARGNRVYASHPGAGRLTMLSVKDNRITEYDTDGRVNGIAIDYSGNRFYAAGGNQKVVIFDYKTMNKLGEIPLPGNADDIVFDPDNRTLYVTHDDGTELWTVDVDHQKVTGNIAIAGAPEYIEYDAKTHRLYQNIKTANEVQVIDPVTNTVVATWSTEPVESPHGLALDARRGWLFFAGEGKAGVIDIKTGKLISSVSFGSGYVDQIAFDAGLKRLYCACGNGYLAVLQETSTGLKLLGNVEDHRGSHTLAVDPHTHTVWVCYGDRIHSYLQAFHAE